MEQCQYNRLRIRIGQWWLYKILKNVLEDRKEKYIDEIWLSCFALSLLSQLCSRFCLPTLTGGKSEVAEYQSKKKAGFKVITLKIIQPLQIILQIDLARITACLEGSEYCHVCSQICVYHTTSTVFQRGMSVRLVFHWIFCLHLLKTSSFLAFSVKTDECLLF